MGTTRINGETTFKIEYMLLLFFLFCQHRNMIRWLNDNFKHWLRSLHLTAVSCEKLLSLVDFEVKAFHYENTPIQIYWKFHLQKLKIFRQKNSDIFYTPA